MNVIYSMKILLALFSFLAGEVYHVDAYQCESNQIQIEYEGTQYSLQLFNIILEEDANVCEYMKGEMTFVFDPYVKIEAPFNVYVFMDQQLLQQTLVDRKEAKVKIHNPSYLYQIREQSEPIMKEIDIIEQGVSDSRKIAYALLVLWLFSVLLLICLRLKNKKIKRN